MRFFLSRSFGKETEEKFLQCFTSFKTTAIFFFLRYMFTRYFPLHKGAPNWAERVQDIYHPCTDLLSLSLFVRVQVSKRMTTFSFHFFSFEFVQQISTEETPILGNPIDSFFWWVTRTNKIKLFKLRIIQISNQVSRITQ